VKHMHPQVVGGNLRESFNWAPDECSTWRLEIRFLAQTEAGSVYHTRAIHVTDIEASDSTKTRNGVEFTEEELKVAARSLGYRPPDLNHDMPFLGFPQNRVIDAEFEDARVEALIAVRDTSIMSMIESKKITAVSIEAQFRWADVVCDDESCWLRPVGIILTGLGPLTPGVLPGDPLASIVMKRSGQPIAGARPALSVILGTTQKVDTTPTEGGVILKTKQAAPPHEQPSAATPAPPETVPSTEQLPAEETKSALTPTAHRSYSKPSLP